MSRSGFALILSFVLFSAIGSSSLLAESTVYTRLVSMPTAASLQSRSYQLDTRLFDGGGMVHSISYGVSDLIDIGVSFGGSNIIGSSRVAWQSHVGAQVSVRIVEESIKNPAFLIGFDSQGDGAYIGGGFSEPFSE